MVHLSLLLTVYSPGYSKRAVRSGAQGRNIDKGTETNTRRGTLLIVWPFDEFLILVSYITQDYLP